jgi:acyl carrier protein
MGDLYPRLAELLEVDAVQPSDVLEAFALWDSLTVLSVLAVLDSAYGVNLTAQDLRAIRTAGELADLVASRRPD